MSLFESLFKASRSRSRSLGGPVGPSMTPGGRRLEYLSGRKIRTLASEYSVPEKTAHTSSATFDPKGASFGIGSWSSTRTHASNRDWPVDLAEEVTKKLIASDQVSTIPDYSKRYFAGCMYMVGGILTAMDFSEQKPRAAWFVGADATHGVMLCGSDDHLREHRPTLEGEITWYPSRLDELSFVVQSMVKFAVGEQVVPRLEYDREPRRSHSETVEHLMSVISPSTMRGDPFLEGWVEFIAFRHFSLPAGACPEEFSSIVVGTPLWVAEYRGDPPPGQYPDPMHDRAPGSSRWWDGKEWSTRAVENGSQVESPAPASTERPIGWLTGRSVWLDEFGSSATTLQ